MRGSHCCSNICRPTTAQTYMVTRMQKLCCFLLHASVFAEVEGSQAYVSLSSGQTNQLNLHLPPALPKGPLPPSEPIMVHRHLPSMRSTSAGMFCAQTPSQCLSQSLAHRLLPPPEGPSCLSNPILTVTPGHQEKQVLRGWEREKPGKWNGKGTHTV